MECNTCRYNRALLISFRVYKWVQGRVRVRVRVRFRLACCLEG